MSGKYIVPCMLMLGWSVYAQQDQGSITGTITDNTGAVVPNALVTAREVNTNIVVSHRTNQEGVYFIGPLKIGVYEVTVEGEGFKKAIRSGVELHANDRIGLNFSLEVGNVIEVIEVTGQAPILQTETSSLDYVVSRRQITEFPLNSRNYQTLAQLSAGVVPEIGGRDRAGGFVTHGQPALQNNFIIDGIDNNSTVMGMQDRKAQAIIPSLDAVQEFKVQTSNYSAEFGRNAGAVVNVTIRSGTNDFHGTAYEFLRNDVFDARPTFGYTDRDGDGKADPEVLRQNQFGGTFGGALIRNRTFFFGSWEAWRIRHAQSDLSIVPTALERAGDFSQTARVTTLRDPLGGTFPGRRIPSSRFDPVAVKLISLYPAPNFSGSTRQNYVSNPPWREDRDQYDLRMDHRFSDSDSIFGRYSFYRYDNLRGAPLPLPGRGGVGNDRGLDNNDGRHLVISETHVFSPTVVNEARYGLKWLKVDKQALTRLTRSEVASEYGIQGLPDRESLFGLPLVALGGSVNFRGLGEGGFLPNFKISRTNQFVDNLTWIRSNHTLKFGADIRYDFTNILGAQNSLGNFNFNGRYTGVSLGDFLLGWTNQATLSTLAESDMLFRSWMFYTQDDWKVTPSLTLNLGLRYELTTPWVEKQNRMNKILFGSGTDFGRVLRAGERGSGYSSRGLVNLDRNNFAPRVGFAWQPAPNWTVRSGAGMFYGGQMSLGASERMISNHPFTARVQARGTNRAPALLLRNGYAPDFLGDLDAPVQTVADLPPESQTRHWSDDFALPLVYQWNFSLQRQLSGNLALTTAYVGSSSSNIAYSYDANAAGIGDPDTERQRRRLFPHISQFDYRTPAAHASYHGLDVNLEKRFAAGWSFMAGYTWSHSISQIAEQFVAGDIGGPQNIECFSCDRGNASNDTRHRFIGSSILDLPFGQGRRFLNRGGFLDALFGGWQLAGIFSVQSGQFFDLSLPNALGRLGTGGVASWRPNVVGDWRVANPTPDRWFNPDAFAEPCDARGQNCTFGNLGRNTLTEDGLMNLDMGLMKRFRVTERVGLQLRWEVFNVTNHPTYGTPVDNLTSPDVGKIRDTISTERQMQFGLRISF